MPSYITFWSHPEFGQGTTKQIAHDSIDVLRTVKDNLVADFQNRTGNIVDRRGLEINVYMADRRGFPYGERVVTYQGEIN